MEKICLLVLCGGRSAEHEISLISGWNLCKKLQQHHSFDLTLITLDKEGRWFLQDISSFLEQEPNPRTIHFGSTMQHILLQTGPQREKFLNLHTDSFLPGVDVVFPLLHGPNGEDGSMQGLLRHLQIPFIGPSVLGSAVCMDKDVAKRLMQQAGIPTSKFVAFTQKSKPTYEEVVEQLGLPLFVKPANMGSSVGVSKIRNEKEYLEAISEAFQYDHKLVIEEFVEGIEVECAVLGNEDAVVSRAGTYVHSDDFFDYDTKYEKGTEVVMQIPAEQLTEPQQAEVMNLSVKAYHALCCSGLARVDTFFTTDGRFLVNEINTLPGFTQNSMYPILMEDKGFAYADLVKKLCVLAMEKLSPDLQ